MTRHWQPTAAALAAALALAAGACAPGVEETSGPAAPETGAAPGQATGAAPGAETGGAVAVDPALPVYSRASGISGSLSSVGSDTLNNLMTLWAESFRRQYPSVRIQIEGKGSSTAPPALIEGTAQIGPMSRAMKPSEVDAFEERFGYGPTRIRVAIDALAVYVHRDNPLERLTVPELDAMYSRTRACGHPRDLTSWGAAGLAGEWAERPVSLYGRNSASGTYGYFKEHALCGGDFLDTVKEQPGSASVVNGVTADRNGIGYSGIGYRTSGVRALALAREEGAAYFGIETEHVLSGDYPLARFLYLYVNKAPNRPLDPLVRELLSFVLSQEGQQVVVKDGYLPLSAELAEEELEKLR